MPPGVEPPYFQVQLSSNEMPQALRTLKSSHIGSLINVSAIIINSGKTTLRGKRVIAKCKGCSHLKEYFLTTGYEGVSLPFICARPREAG
jgi:DNA replication licensing factor MCM5